MINDVRHLYAPDTRTAIFNIECENSEPIILQGETNLPQAKSTLLKKLDSAEIRYQDEIYILPKSSLGEDTLALINVSVANLRSQPKHSAELVTQALLGTPLKVYKKSGSWLLVQTPDKYIAWTNSSQLEILNPERMSSWKKSRKVIFLRTEGFALAEDKKSKVSDLVLGNVLELEEETISFWKVRYPDARLGLVDIDNAQLLGSWTQSMEISDTSLINASLDLMGIPYLWGGTSSKGADCSGFTKTVYIKHGIILPRDASQQVHVGILVDEKKQFDKLQIGDLLFFGRKLEDGKEKVVHVGLWIGNNKFIHASGDVHISSMDSLAEDFDEYNLNRYLRTKRVIGQEANLPVSFAETYGM